MDFVFFILEIIGTISFSFSGAIIAVRKRMDLLGIFVLSATTALGGGIIRDIFLGNVPPTAFNNPIYIIISIIVSVIMIFPQVIKFINKTQKRHQTLWIVFDSIGLGAFSVLGLKTALSTQFSDNILLVIFCGVVTGVGGGVIRDIMSNDTPIIFIKYFYAFASLIGVSIMLVLWEIFNEIISSMFIGMVIIFVLRLLAAKYEWNLPKPIIEDF